MPDIKLEDKKYIVSK